MEYSDILKLGRWNTPTIYNGWEQITSRDHATECFNKDVVVDFMPQMGTMVGRAITVVCEPSNPAHKEKPNAWSEFRSYVASIGGPKILVVQDLDSPHFVGAFLGEVNASFLRSAGCIGSICPGTVRDVDEMTNAGFKVIAKRLCVGHAHSTPISWGDDIEVFGTSIKNRQLVHADKHGFLAIPEEDEAVLLNAAKFMDDLECSTVIPAAKNINNLNLEESLNAMNEAATDFRNAVKNQFSGKGEW